jgi:hypothetical protein
MKFLQLQVTKIHLCSTRMKGSLMKNGQVLALANEPRHIFIRSLTEGHSKLFHPAMTLSNIVENGTVGTKVCDLVKKSQTVKLWSLCREKKGWGTLVPKRE